MQKEVSHLLLNYLANHNMLALAGIGRFSREYRPAHFAGNQLKAPASIFYFDADQSLKENPPALAKALAAHQLDEKETFRALQMVFEEVNRELGQQKRYTYPGLGNFERVGARIEFKPDSLQFLDTYAYGLESVLVQAKVIEAQTTESEKVTPAVVAKRKPTNFWLKVAASVLFLMVANFAVLYFLEQQDQGNGLMQQAEMGQFDSVQLPVITPNTLSEIEKTGPAQSNDTAIQAPLAESEQPQAETTINPSVTTQFTVIVGAFREAANAEKYIQDLKNNGYSDAAAAGTTASGLHRVSVAKFSSQEMAEAYLEEIKRKLQADAWLMN